MSEQEFKKGDRVKVTIEGTVIRDLASHRDVFLNDSGASYPAHHVVDTTKPGVTIEKVADPLPTTPGSVIRNRNYGSLYMRVDGGWLGEDGEFTPWTLTPTIYEPIFDAGAAK